MNEKRRSDEEIEFIRAYNSRLRWARVAVWPLAVAVLVLSSGRVEPEHYPTLWATIGVSGLFYAYSNWVRGKCPRCGRFIGYSDWAQQGLPRGLRCAMETACADALDAV